MTQPTLIGDTDYIGIFEYAEHRYKADAEDMLIIKEIQHRSLSFGEGEGG
ncbi:MAG: hypothetical protein ABI675_24200 [Chitinophagaceae bacterium]